MAESKQKFINPLDIPHILSLVLEYVGATNVIGDLLSCRLVNHNWNNTATEMLKKRGVRVALRDRNIYSYRQLLQISELEANPRGFDVVDHTRSIAGPTTNTQCNRLPLNIYMPHYGDWVSVDYGCWNRKMENHLKSLVNQVQDVISSRYNCEVEGIFDFHGLIETLNFTRLLQLTSSTLVNLYLTPGVAPSSGSVRKQGSPLSTASEKNNLDQLDIVSFPKLKHIEYSIEKMSGCEPLPTRFNKIVESAPALQSLVITEYFPFVTNLIQPQDWDDEFEDIFLKFERKYVTAILDGIVVTQISQLNDWPFGVTLIDIPIYNEESLTSLCQLFLPNLKTLKLRQKLICMVYQSFCEFLAHHCPVLHSLDLYFLSYYKTMEYEQVINDPSFDRSFPQVAQITHVGLFITLPDVDELEPQVFTFHNQYKSPLMKSAAIIAAKFVSLSSISSDVLALGTLAFGSVTMWVVAGPHFLAFGGSVTAFPNVTELCFVLQGSHNLEALLGNVLCLRIDEINREITRRAGLMCPGLTKLVIMHDEYAETDGLDWWIPISGLQGILGIGTIKNLEIYNYIEWLPFLINENNDNLDETMEVLRQNLTHLKFGDNTRTRENYFFESDKMKIKPSFLKRVMDHFTSLEVVQIPEQVIRKSTKNEGGLIPFERVLNKLNLIRASVSPAINIQLY